MIPEELRYTESHEWVKCDGNVATIGITHYAQEQLTDIVFVELPEEDREVEKGEECVVIESCKIAADLYAPVSGKIVAINEELSDHPDFINKEPYEKGWIIKIEMSDTSEVDALMDAAAYASHIEKSA
jgi:glycine cleavage system H protein